MKSKNAEKIIEKINEAINDINCFQNISDIEKSYLAKFLVVFICGIYEEAIETIVKERASKCNDIYINKYIAHSIEKSFKNPDIGNIKGLLKKFNEQWSLEIENIDANNLTAVDNIVNNKNSLAHGIDITLTLHDTIQYYQDSLVVINKIDEMLL